jgi:site-specific DNA recombinase
VNVTSSTSFDAKTKWTCPAGPPLDQREGLRTAVEAVEAGEADVIVAAYFDRLVRSLQVQGEVVQRVERAGGSVLAIDVGEVSEGTAGQWLSGTMLGAVNEYQRRSAKERSAAAQERAVARGAPPWARVTPGYRRQDDGTYAVNEQEAPIARRAFEMRDEGTTITEIRAMLKAHGIERSHRGVQVMLANRAYLGEIHFGDLHNLDAHTAIIDRELFNRVQKRKVPRGPKPKSSRLLSRLGVLRCGSCNSRLSVAIMPQGGGYPIYRCGSTSDCAHHVVISAEIAEKAVVKRVREELADAEGRADAERGAREAKQALAAAESALDAAVRAFDGLGDLDSATDRLRELRGDVDDAQARVDQLGDGTTIERIVGGRDWDKLTLDEKRALIRAMIAEITVAPGRGDKRITIKAVGD